MRNYATAAFMALPAFALGTAHITNNCNYPVYLVNTPSANGGYSDISRTLVANTGTYEQEWTELTNGNGWSMKLSNTTSLANILQYEYTFHDDGTIWYDLSEVNGNPWYGNWEITASTGCNPKQAAYRCATDDAYGMQACPDTADITVTICSVDPSKGAVVGASLCGEAPPPVYSASANSSTAAVPTSTASSVWSSDSTSTTSSVVVEQPTVSDATTTVATTAEATTAAAPTTTTAQTYGGNWGHHSWNGKAVAQPSPTTLVSSVITTQDANGYDTTVTDIVTQVATATVYAKRDNHHHARHPHHVR